MENQAVSVYGNPELSEQIQKLQELRALVGKANEHVSQTYTCSSWIPDQLSPVRDSIRDSLARAGETLVAIQGRLSGGETTDDGRPLKREFAYPVTQMMEALYESEQTNLKLRAQLTVLRQRLADKQSRELDDALDAAAKTVQPPKRQGREWL